MRPAAHLLFLYAQEKEAKESAPKSATPSLRFGANLRHGTCGVRRGTHCALARSVQTTAASQTTLRVHPAVHAPPRKHRAAGAATGVLMRAIAALGPGFELPSGRAEKRSGWGGHGEQSMPMQRALTCCGCSSEVNAVNEASSAAPPQARASQVARSEAQGHGQWGRLSFAFFSLATQRKEGAPPGAHPGQRDPAPSTAHQAAAQPSNAQKPLNRCPAPSPGCAPRAPAASAWRRATPAAARRRRPWRPSRPSCRRGRRAWWPAPWPRAPGGAP